jgi:hypothetical protein
MTEPNNQTDNESKIQQLKEAIAGFDYALQGMAIAGMEIPADLKDEYMRLSQELDELTSNP